MACAVAHIRQLGTSVKSGDNSVITEWSDESVCEGVLFILPLLLEALVEV